MLINAGLVTTFAGKARVASDAIVRANERLRSRHAEMLPKPGTRC